jgi:glutamyl-tRNA synthetase
MASLLIATKANQATTFPVLLIASFANESNPSAKITFDFEEVDKLSCGNGAALELKTGPENSIYDPEKAVAALLAQYPSLQDKKADQVKEWLERSKALYPTDFKAVEPHILELDAHLTLRSYIVGYTLTVADLAVFGAIRGNRVSANAMKKGAMVNVTRWYKFIEESNPWITAAIQSINAAALEKRNTKAAAGASYDIALKDTEKGVVTRFPPEPSGYLHIGHAKAALLNDYFAHEAYKGTMICRFDDTNPTKEKEEFQDAIVEDLALMGIRPDKTTYSSDYFQIMYDYCIQLIKAGKAYADDTEQELMRAQRWDGIASSHRDDTPEQVLAHFEEMKKGSEEGLRWCIRAKISVDNPNKAMRDPTIYRCNLTPHHRTGTQWKLYPIYDFCVPIVDSIEGITHALRTNEYRDRNPQYEWFQDALGLRKVHIWDFARMNFVRTLLSKRKLTKLVDRGAVSGWDDPRFPTIRGIRRRGMTIGALREFILKQGPSRNIINLDWHTFWATNKKYIDPVAPRHTAIDTTSAVTCTIKGVRAAAYSEDKPKHGKNPDLGTKKVFYSPTILIEQKDAASLAQDEEITLMNWGNAIVRSITHSLNQLSVKTVTAIEMDLNLQGDFKTTSKKITWLAKEQELIPVEMVDFDYLITKDKLEEEDEMEDFLNPKTEFKTVGLADCNVAELKRDDVIQFERKGYFRVDRAFVHGQPAVLFAIPSGKEEKKGK